MRPLGVVKEIVESVGMSISYAYEDLVFLAPNALLLQFTDNDELVLIHINIEAARDIVGGDIARLREAGLGRGLRFDTGHYYSVTQTDDENIRIEFIQAN